MKKRFLSTLTALALTLSLLPTAALAAEEQTPLEEAQAAQQALADALEAENVTWSILYDATLSYNSLEAGTEKDELTAYYASIESLDLSGQSIEAVYGFTDLGVLVPFTGLKTLDVSDTGVDDLGALAYLTKLETLDVSDNPGIDNVGAFISLPLVSLDLSGTQIASIASLTTNDTNSACAETLEELNISNTKVTQLQEVWNGATRKPSLPKLKTLTARGLELTSISGLVEIANQQGFDPTVLTWDIRDSMLTDGTYGVSHVQQILNKFGDAGSFTAPTQAGEGVEGIPASVSSAQSWKNKLAAALGTDGGKTELTWDTLITAVHWYETATKEVETLTDGATKTACNSILGGIENAFESITTLDMSDKKDSQYAISTGALVHFTGLESLNLSNTGISDTGGLKGLTKLETLDLSGNQGIDNTAFGALADMAALTDLDLSGTGITDIGGLTEANDEIEGSDGVADTLETLDISNTGVTRLESIWGAEEAASPAFSALKTLNARGLALESISGLARMAEQTGFSASDYTWDLFGSTLSGTAANGTNLAAIQEKFSDGGSFSAPTYIASTAEDLTNAQTALDDLKTELEGDNKASWDTLITAVHYYQQAQNYVEGLADGADKTAAETILQGITDGFAAITTLDMSDQSSSRYAISTGALEPFTGLTSLNLSNTGIRETGGLAGLTRLETLDLSGNTGINNTHFGALANMEALTDLDLSGTGITDIGGLTEANDKIEGSDGVADTLETLDISNTGVTRLESVWNGTASAFPELKTLTAQNLTLDSISGLANIASQSGFVADGITWDLGGSTLTNTETNLDNVNALRVAFAGAGTFHAPTVPAENMPQALVSALAYRNGFNEKVAAGELDWDYLITAIHWFRTAENSWEGLTSGAAKEQCETTWNDIRAFYASITELDMSDKDTSQYTISTGALTDFTGLESLNLSNTGIIETGGLEGLTRLKTLDLSGNPDIKDTHFGALANMNALTDLDLSGTGITDIGGLTGTGGSGVADTLVTLDISNTGVTRLESVWDGTATFPALKTLTAQGLTLDSISGLVEIASHDGFMADGITWDLSGSKMPATNGHGDDNQNHVDIITAKLGGQFTAPTVEAKDPGPSNVPVTGVTLDQTALALTVGQTGTLTATVKPANATNPTVTWSSDNEAVATVSGGVVTAVAEGTAMITVATVDGNHTASCIVTVTATPVQPTIHTILASAGTGGRISPSGNVSVADGGSQTFTIAANSRYQIASVVVDGVSQGVISAYTFEKVLENHTITANFHYVGGGSSGGSSGGGGGGSTTYTIVTPGNVTGGEVSVSPSRAERGETVTITVTPDDGYELSGITVTDASGNQIDVERQSATRYTFKMPSGRVTVKATFAEIEEEPVTLVFIDVPTSAYYYDAVYWAVINGVTNGTSTTTFSPDVTVTRAQMMTFLWRAHGSPTVSGGNPFVDVSSDSYYYNAVLWAVENGITNGTSAATFSPDAPVTRAQAVTFQWRAAGSPAVSGGSFGDVPTDTYYATAVAWAVENGITNGTDGNNFSPDNPVSRAQAVTFLWRELA